MQPHHAEQHHRPADGSLRDLEDAPASAEIALLFYITVFCLIAAQVGLFVWKAKHKRSYELVSLLGLWVTPAVLSFEVHYYRFLLVWAAYSSATAYLLHQCSARHISSTTPRRVYEWYGGCHKVCVALGGTGYALLLLEVFGGDGVTARILPKGTSLLLLWYGLYFGILGRDCAEVLTDRMSSIMGGRRQLSVSLNNCNICGGDLTGGDRLAHMRPASETSKLEATLQLECRHIFHDACIRGWTMVGKKDVCPVCGEKVNLQALYKNRPWETRNLSWIQMLDAIRYLIVWNPIILIVLHFVFHVMGVDGDTAHSGRPHNHERGLDLHPELAGADTGNGTMRVL